MNQFRAIPWALFLFLTTGLCSPVLGQERDREEDMFGTDPRSDDIFSDNETDEDTSDPFEEDTLEMGGSLYFQLSGVIPRTQNLNDYAIQAPGNLDLYLDARPNDRLRGFAKGRVLWNPSATDGDTPSTFGTSQKRTDALLDELWMRFDAARTVFFTVGQAHVRWGATRIWNPVDVVQPSRKDPLAFYDLRTGVPQVKMHIPVESLGWNFYLLGLLDLVDTARKAGGAIRSELVFGTVEMGLTGAMRYGMDPKTGVDISAGIGDVDLTGECGLSFARRTPEVQVSSGLEYTVPIFDEDSLILGTEFFYNPGGYNNLEDAVLDTLGFSDSEVELATQYFQNRDAGDLDAANLSPESQEALDKYSQSLQQLEPFYIGKLYGGALIMLPRPGTWNDTSFTLLTLSNLSDLSALSRFDVSYQALTYLQVQTYISGFWGRPGELQPGPGAWGEIESLLAPLVTIPPRQLLQLGLNLRMSL